MAVAMASGLIFGTAGSDFRRLASNMNSLLALWGRRAAFLVISLQNETPKIDDFWPGGSIAQPEVILIGFGAMDVTKTYEFIGFGAMDVTKPYEL